MSVVSSTSSSLVSPSRLSDDTVNVLSDSTSAPFSAPIVQISEDEYDRLRQLEFYQTGHLLTHSSSSGVNAYIASPHRPWILDSEPHLT